jgi:hypothetical protein
MLNHIYSKLKRDIKVSKGMLRQRCKDCGDDYLSGLAIAHWEGKLQVQQEIVSWIEEQRKNSV